MLFRSSELVYEGEKLPPIKAFDTLENVIYIYSFSLTFVPGLSLAFVTGNRDFVRALSYLVSVRLMASDWLTQKLLGMYLDDGSYYAALARFREEYRRKRDLVCRRLDELAARHTHAALRDLGGALKDLPLVAHEPCSARTGQRGGG